MAGALSAKTLILSLFVLLEALCTAFVTLAGLSLFHIFRLVSAAVPVCPRGRWLVQGPAAARTLLVRVPEPRGLAGGSQPTQPRARPGLRRSTANALRLQALIAVAFWLRSAMLRHYHLMDVAGNGVCPASSMCSVAHGGTQAACPVRPQPPPAQRACTPRVPARWSTLPTRGVH
jgi:hypothetical protein